jgi:GNAT superfamily N-acetyltransferase
MAKVSIGAIMLLMKIDYRKATLEDLPQVMEAVEDSRALLKEQGNGQWQDGYPNRNDFINDINNGRLFVTYLDDPNEIVGVCALTYREEDYHHLYEGKWLTDFPYMVMHRVAIKKKYKDKGLGKKLFEVFIEQAKLEGYKSLRIDTHEGNAIMRHIITSFGFVYCGKAILTPDKDRMVFEKVLN